MKKRFINIIILIILIVFLITIYFTKVGCIFKQLTGIYCPSCGMTRAFYSIISFNFMDAFYYNILSIPLFLFIIYFIFNLLLDILKNRFTFIPKIISFFSKYYIFIIVLIIISFIFNNIKI